MIGLLPPALQPTRVITRLGVAVALAASSIAACSTTPSATPQPATAAPTARPSGPLPIRVGTATQGSYTTTAFKPALTFTITSDGWLFFFQDDDDEMAVGKSGDIELTAGRVGRVVDPQSHQGVAAPDDLVAWLASHPDLDAEPPQPVRIAGLGGQSIDVTNNGLEEVDIFAYPTGNLHLDAGTRFRIWVLPYEGPDLVFCAIAPKASFEQALPEIQSIVDSVRIGSS